VKVGVWCAVSARRVVGHVISKEAINYERYVQVVLGQFCPELTAEGRLYDWFQQDSAIAPTARMPIQALSDERELSAAVFVQHVPSILIVVISSSGVG
jgi:hypothetical protein